MSFGGSLGPGSPAIEYWRCGPAGPAIMAPTAAAANIIDQIRGDDGGMLAVALLHQFEKDVRLLGFQI